MTGYDHILVPTDGSPCATAAAEHAIDLARTVDATVHAIYVINAADIGLTTPADVGLAEVRSSLRVAGERATEAVVDAAADAGVEADATVRVGIPHEEICEYAEAVGADLVVMGTHGRTGLDRVLLGSVTERVVRTCSVPVLTVRESVGAATDGE